jgi:hypothetical protein
VLATRRAAALVLGATRRQPGAVGRLRVAFRVLAARDRPQPPRHDGLVGLDPVLQCACAGGVHSLPIIGGDDAGSVTRWVRKASLKG